MLSAACIVFSSLAGCGGSETAAAEKQIRQPARKADGSVIKILAYDGWEQEHADIRAIRIGTELRSSTPWLTI
ncbi:MAG: hypothetical protein ACLR56_03180 [Oscillospiraceae bacterium]